MPLLTYTLSLSLYVSAAMATSVLIVGGGTMGLSTAYWMSKDSSNYTSITILDPYGKNFTASAGNDINKIVRAEYADPMMAQIALEAMNLWETDPVFADMYVKAGYLSGSFGSNTSTWDQAIANMNLYQHSGELRLLGADDYADFPWLGTPPSEWRGAYNGDGGWVDAAGALGQLATYLDSLPNVKFIGDAKGTATELIMAENSTEVTGVKSADGAVHQADIIVLAMGAWSTGLKGMDYKSQAWPSTWMVTNVVLNDTELEVYKNMSVFNAWNAGSALDQLAGYFFPPLADGTLKVVANVQNYTHWTHYDNTTTPATKVALSIFDPHAPYSALPAHDNTAYRTFMDVWLPGLSSKLFTGSHSCSSLTTFDNNWILGPLPSSPKNVFLATGGNGDTFKNLVNVGKYVRQAVEGTMSSEIQKAFFWRASDVDYTDEGQLDLDVQPMVEDGSAIVHLL